MRLFLPALVMLRSVTAMAADQATSQAQPQSLAVFDYSQLSEVMVGLGLVVLLIVACAWVIRKLNGAGLASNSAIRIVAVLPLGIKEKLILVQVGTQQLLLGITPGQITTLQTFEKPVVDVPETIGGQDFPAKLKSVLKRGADQ